MNTRKLKGIGIGILALFPCVLSFAVWLHIRVNYEKNHPVTCDTPDEAYEYVISHSNIFSDSSLCMAPVLWPQENFIIDLASKHKDSTYLIYCSGADTIKISYKPVTFKIKNKPVNSCKNFIIDTIKNSTLKNKFYSAIDACQCIPIDSTYEQEIINAPQTFLEQDKKLSRIYNVLAGSCNGFVILGKEGSSNTWKCYQLEDFPQNYLDEIKLLRFVQYHLKNKDLTPAQCFKNNQFITQENELNIVYYDFRGDKVIEQNGVKKKHTDPTLSHDINKLKLSKGWLNYKVSNQDGTQKWKLVYAYDYFVDSQRKFIRFGSDKGQTLELAVWSERQTTPKWIIILLYSLAGACAVGGLVLLLIVSIRLKEGKQKTDTHVTSSNTTSTNAGGVKMTIVKPNQDELVSDPNPPIDIEKLQADLTQKAKDIEDLKAVIEDLKKRPTAKEVETIKTDAVKKYKDDNDIDKRLKEAERWRQFVSHESVKGLYSTLDEIRKNHPKFPKLETLKSVYDAAVDSSKDLVEQMLYVLSQLETQTKSTDNWRQRFITMCNAEKYANNVKVKYDKVEKYVNGVVKKKEVLEVLKKDSHNYLDRIALSYWSVEGFNTLLEIFQQPHLSKDNEKSLQDTLYFDMLQLLMTRVFFIYNADGKPTAIFQSDIRDMLNERLDALENVYHLRSDKREKFAETAKSLDDAFDQMRSTDEFVSRMYDVFVKEFSEKADSNEEKAWFFGMMVAMGYHTVDFVRRKKNISINLCPNYAYLLTDFDNSKLPEESYFKYKDYAHSVEYSNRIYEWLDEMGVQHLKALVGRQLIKP